MTLGQSLWVTGSWDGPAPEVEPESWVQPWTNTGSSPMWMGNGFPLNSVSSYKCGDNIMTPGGDLRIKQDRDGSQLSKQLGMKHMMVTAVCVHQGTGVQPIRCTEGLGASHRGWCHRACSTRGNQWWLRSLWDRGQFNYIVVIQWWQMGSLLGRGATGKSEPQTWMGEDKGCITLSSSSQEPLNTRQKWMLLQYPSL